VKLEALLAPEPLRDLGCLVGAHVVEDDVDRASRVGPGEEVEKAEELRSPMASRRLVGHLPGRDREGGVDRVVASVTVGFPSAPVWSSISQYISRRAQVWELPGRWGRSQSREVCRSVKRTA
jgi:hypothetical protein